MRNMCEPFSAAAAGISIASTILGTVASVNSNRYQASVADDAARAATQQAGFEASRQANDTARLLARQRAAYAAAGIGSSGTPLDVGFDLAGEGRLEERRILHAGALQANEQTARARLARYGTRVDLLQGLTQIGSDLLAGIERSGIGGGTGAPKGPKPPYRGAL